MKRRGGRALASLLGLAAGPAAAHSAIAGIGSFYNGVLHPYTTAPHLIALIACGLLIGQRGLTANGRVVVLLFAALAGGLVGGSFINGGVEAAVLPLQLLLATAAALAVLSRLAVPRRGLMALAASLGLLIGLDSTPELLSGGARWMSLLGTLLGAGLCSVYIAQAVEALEGVKGIWQAPLRIAVRILASWVAAAALLVLALQLAGRT